MNSQRLKAKRLWCGYDDRQMAEFLGLKDAGSYHRKETGRTGISIKEMIIIAQALDLTLNEINLIFFDDQFLYRSPEKSRKKMLAS